MTTDTITTTPTEKQATFLRKLLTERHAGADLDTRLAKLDAWLPTATKASASLMITQVLERPKLTAVDTGPSTCATLLQQVATFAKPADGSYALADAEGTLRFYRVKAGRKAGIVFLDELASDTPYPIRRNDPRYLPVLAALAADEQAAATRYGVELEHCARCHRALTDATSRARGIGPDCWSILGYSD